MRKFLRHIKFVDLKRSILDRTKSDPEKGVYVFKEKKFLTYLDNSAIPLHKLKFHRDTPMDIQGSIADGWTFVELSDPYYPEGAVLNAEKHWQFQDMILMKRRLEDYLDDREDAVTRSNQATAAVQAKFDSRARSEGAKPFSKAEREKLVADTEVEIKQ